MAVRCRDRVFLTHRQRMVATLDGAQQSGFVFRLGEALLVEPKAGDLEERHEQTNDGCLPLDSTPEFLVFVQDAGYVVSLVKGDD